jgi:hypothetical protein
MTASGNHANHVSYNPGEEYAIYLPHGCRSRLVLEQFRSPTGYLARKEFLKKREEGRKGKREEKKKDKIRGPKQPRGRRTQGHPGSPVVALHNMHAARR